MNRIKFKGSVSLSVIRLPQHEFIIARGDKGLHDFYSDNKKVETEVSTDGSNGAEDRNRTGTNLTIRGILSPLRLPVPPPRQVYI